MTEEIKRIDIKEFREKGFLQEVNRKFFHPLGLALEVIINEETGEETLGGIWDYRDDPEGMFFGQDMISKKKIDHVEDLRKSKIKARYEYDGVEVDLSGMQVLEKNYEEYTQSFDYDKKAFGDRDDVKAHGFFMILESLYLDGKLNIEPVSKKVFDEDNKRVFHYDFKE
jgi:hypothetical protein